MEINKNGILLVGDWTGEADGNRFWTNKELALWFDHHQKRLDRARDAEDFKSVKETVEDFEKEINRRKGHRYIGVQS